MMCVIFNLTQFDNILEYRLLDLFKRYYLVIPTPRIARGIKISFDIVWGKVLG